MKNKHPQKGLPEYAILAALELNTSEMAILHAVENQKMAGHTAKIARAAGVPPTTAAYSLEKLLRWNLVRKIQTQKRRFWIRNKPI